MLMYRQGVSPATSQHLLLLLLLSLSVLTPSPSPLLLPLLLLLLAGCVSRPIA
jgi:hypothetical protein